MLHPASFIFTGRLAAKRQTAGIKFTHSPKISIFTPHGQLVAPIHIKFSTDVGHMRPLGLAKFHASCCTGVGTWLQNGKNFHFLAVSPHRGELFDRFLQLLGAFIHPTTLH